MGAARFAVAGYLPGRRREPRNAPCRAASPSPLPGARFRHPVPQCQTTGILEFSPKPAGWVAEPPWFHSSFRDADHAAIDAACRAEEVAGFRVVPGQAGIAFRIGIQLEVEDPAGPQMRQRIVNKEAPFGNVPLVGLTMTIEANPICGDQVEIAN